jgi:hypothetical protein
MGEVQLMLVEPAKTVLTQIVQFLVNVLLVLAILLIGWLISRLLKTLVTKICRVFKLDEFSKRIEFDALMIKGGFRFSLSELIGTICYWLGMLVTSVVALNAIGLTVAADLLNRIVLYVPNIVVAIFLLIFGMFIATIFKNIVKTAATNAGLAYANLFSKIVEVFVLVFTVLVILEQLGIGARIIEIIITIVLGSIGLAFALAFGFGCQDIAKKVFSDTLEKLKAKKVN